MLLRHISADPAGNIWPLLQRVFLQEIKRARIAAKVKGTEERGGTSGIYDDSESYSRSFLNL